MNRPSNRICPRCGKGGYINYIGQSNIYEAKCYNCGYYFAFGELDLYEEKKPVTNADRIRAMSDEELVEIFADNDCGYCRIHDFCFAKDNAIDCEAVWQDWLKQEEGEG